MYGNLYFGTFLLSSFDHRVFFWTLTMITRHHAIGMSDDTISIAIGPKQCSEKKKQQLAQARTLALDSRRRSQKDRLEAKLDELKRVMAGISDDHLARVATQMMAQEETLRGKQNQITQQINVNLQNIMNEVADLKQMLKRIVHPANPR